MRKRSEVWPRLYEEITEGTREAPRNYHTGNPWGSIIAESRFDYLQGPLADYWRRKEIQLERATKQSRTQRIWARLLGLHLPLDHQAINKLLVQSLRVGALVQPLAALGSRSRTQRARGRRL